jgi:baseplate hub protein gp41
LTQSFSNPKELKFVITLGTGSFGSSSANTITLQGYRAVAEIDKAGGMMMGTLRAQIYGVSQSDMNSSVTYPFQPQKLAAGASVKMNTIQVFAIDGATTTLVFTGNIINAWGNYQNMPDVFLEIQAQAAFVNQLTPVPPTSFNGPIDAATAMQQIAGTMGLTFENNGVSGIILTNQYLANTALEQAKTLADAAGIWMTVDNGVLVITPKYQARNKPAPLISPSTGLMGYPTFDGFGVNFEGYFNPSILFLGPFQIQSSIPQASGMWIATSIAYSLNSEKPDGVWKMRIRGTKSGLSLAA